jgi:hypothetical protein
LTSQRGDEHPAAKWDGRPIDEFKCIEDHRAIPKPRDNQEGAIA